MNLKKCFASGFVCPFLLPDASPMRDDYAADVYQTAAVKREARNKDRQCYPVLPAKVAVDNTVPIKTSLRPRRNSPGASGGVTGHHNAGPGSGLSTNAGAVMAEPLAQRRVQLKIKR